MELELTPSASYFRDKWQAAEDAIAIGLEQMAALQREVVRLQKENEALQSAVTDKAGQPELPIGD
jgi:hypothetical protein